MERSPSPRSEHRRAKRTAWVTATAASCLGLFFSTSVAHSQSPRAPTLDQHSRDPESPKNPPAEDKVKGTIFDGDHKGVADAKVTIKGPKKDTVWTDSNGSFFFTGPAGNYQLTVEANGESQTFSTKIVDKHLEPSSFTFRPGTPPGEPPEKSGS